MEGIGCTRKNLLGFMQFIDKGRWQSILGEDIGIGGGLTTPAGESEDHPVCSLEWFTVHGILIMNSWASNFVGESFCQGDFGIFPEARYPWDDPVRRVYPIAPSVIPHKYTSFEDGSLMVKPFIQDSRAIGVRQKPGTVGLEVEGEKV